MPLPLSTLVVALALLLPARHAAPLPPGATVDPAPHGLPFATVAQGQRSSHPAGQLFTPTTLLLRDQAAWSDFWELHRPSEPPAIDFAEEQVLVVFGGRHLQTGYTVTVERVGARSGALHVTSVLRAPGTGCGGFFVETAPFHVVRLPRIGSTVGSSALRVEFYTCP